MLSGGDFNYIESMDDWRVFVVFAFVYFSSGARYVGQIAAHFFFDR